ncbi:BnaC02g16910D [Brassica napus]|uniref:BnaC02g16910D protein n=1 Tax=Brassica napus TaxID=3708 RepID=A0A078IMI3_BRANA|nr:BnaC02g16910D [Brassica napus]
MALAIQAVERELRKLHRTTDYNIKTARCQVDVVVGVMNEQFSFSLLTLFSAFILLYLLIFFYPFPFPDMDSTPYAHTTNFVELLNSQQDTVFRLVEDSVDPNSLHVPVFGSQSTEASNLGVDKPSERRERRTWSPADDLVLISAWLNTSKDPLVGNEQRSGAFWSRIAAYYAASPKVARGEERETTHCKHRWHKINDLVSKFSGSYEAATREKTSGQNEVDVLNNAHAIFNNNYKKKFTLEHAWRELHMTRNAKARGKKKPMVEKSEFQTICTIKQEDLAVKERLGKMKLLDSLIAKKEPLADDEATLKKKLILELMSN